MSKNLFIILCFLWLGACGLASKEKQTISWGKQVAQKLDSIYTKEEIFISQWLAKIEKMRAFFANNQDKKENYPQKITSLSQKIEFYKNVDIVLYTDSLWQKNKAPVLTPISTTQSNLYQKKYTQNWDTTKFSSILGDQDDINRNIADLQNLINQYKQKEYIVVYKTISFKAPQITDLGFEKGNLEVQAFVYSLDTQSVVMQFSLQAENSNFETFQSKDPKVQKEYLERLLHQQIEYKIQEYLKTCCK